MAETNQEGKHFLTALDAANFYEGGQQKVKQLMDLSSGPFHYQLRASTYGDVWDGIYWREKAGLDEYRGRNAVDKGSVKAVYSPTSVLLRNWVEERRDKKSIITERRPKLSQYAYHYTTTYEKYYGRRSCDLEHCHLRELLPGTGFPFGSFPGHQAELNPEFVRSPVKCDCNCTEKECERGCLK